MVAQPVATISNSRAARKAAWDRALRRAVENNLVALELVGGAYAIQSGTDPDRGYVVDQHGSCTCAAAQHGNGFCQHAALALALRGLIDWPVYEDAAPVLEAVPAPARELCPVTGREIAADGFYVDTCRTCSGLGYTLEGWGPGGYTATCKACQGKGTIPTPAA